MFALLNGGIFEPARDDKNANSLILNHAGGFLVLLWGTHEVAAQGFMAGMEST